MRDEQLAHETRILVPSKKQKTYISCPQMSAQEITDHIQISLEKNPAYFYLVNYANADMVGHSGDFQATIKACEILDKQLTKLYDDIVVKHNGTIFITGDHGNAEEKIDEKTGEPKTSHTTNPVPFVAINQNFAKNKSNYTHMYNTCTYGLKHIAPTVLKHLGLTIPDIMNPEIIFENKT